MDFEKDRIIEVGCLELIDGVFSGKKFHKYYNPDGLKISADAEEIHGLNNSFLSAFPSFDKDIENFIEFVGNAQFIIHNAQFDLSHLNNELKLFGREKIDNEIIDTLILAREKFPGSQASLDALCKRFRIDNSKRVSHTALIDCDLLAKVYINLIDQKEPMLNFQNLEEVTYKNLNENTSYYKKIIKPSSDELAKHLLYLKNYLKNNNY